MESKGSAAWLFTALLLFVAGCSVSGAGPSIERVAAFPAAEIANASEIHGGIDLGDASTVSGLPFKGGLTDRSIGGFWANEDGGNAEFAGEDAAVRSDTVDSEDAGINACSPYHDVPGLEVDANGNPYIANIQWFLNTCPSSDPNLSAILNDFQIRKDGVLVTNFPCSEPVSQMPVAQYTDELIVLQGLRAMYYMDRGQSGHLPWTSGTLYGWMKAKLGGLNIVPGVIGGYCCDSIAGRSVMVLGTADDYNRSFDKTWKGISGNLGFYAHERRHLDGNGFPHSSCCGISNGCDDNFDTSNLSPYGMDWWLNRSWLLGTINVGVGCLSPSIITDTAQWHLSSANGNGRFCYTQPPVLSMPATPEGPCNPRACAWWSSATNLGGGWRWSNWLGFFNVNGAPWIYHQQLGSMYISGTSASNLWIYYPKMGAWLWTSSGTFPWLYRATGPSPAWLFYLEWTTGPIWFHNQTTNLWEAY